MLVVAAVAAGVTARPPYANGPPIRSDGTGYHVWTYALVRGDPSFAWYRGNPNESSLHGPDPATNRHTCKFPPGVALVRLPVMVFLADPNWTGPPFSPAEHQAVLTLGAVALVVTAGLLLDGCRRLGVPGPFAHAAVLLGTFGTGLFHYATYDASFSHAYSAVFVALLVWMAARSVPAGRRVPLAPVAGAVVLLVLIRMTNVVLVGFWAVGVAGWAWRSGGRWAWPLVGAGFGLAVGLGVTAWVNHEMFGRWTVNAYGAETFGRGTPMAWSVLISTEQGLLPVYPVFGVAVAVGLTVRRSRPAAGWLLVLVLAFAGLYGQWPNWHLGQGFGHRGFVELVPLAVPVLAVGLAGLPRRVAWGAVAVGVVATAYCVYRMCEYWGL